MSKITAAAYLIEQLYRIGIKDFFGLPGDYNFKLLKAVQKNKNTNWIGCTNELNAGYAADGYARVNGYGALITTYGVGELSAINAVAGSFAENVPVINIVGVPAVKFIKNNTLLHHNFEHPDYYAFERIYSNVTQAAAYLNETNIKKEIDRVISVLINEKKPVYIAVPVDICEIEIDDISQVHIKKSDETNLNKATKSALELINNSQSPVIIADVLAERFQAEKETRDFVQKSQIPAATLLMGKGLISQDSEQFIGTYRGKHDNKKANEYVNSSDCIISVGVIYSDLNTCGFDFKFNPSDFIQIFGNYTIVKNKRYDNVLMKDILKFLAESVKPKIINFPKESSICNIQEDGESKLTCEYIFPRLQAFLKPDDLIFAETGIITYAVASMKLPEGANLYNQMLWGSIGWATPAAFGGAMAAKDKRVILLTGEGAHQLSASEVSSMMRYGIKPVIIVLNNNGYTIERVLSNEPAEEFNDIAKWHYTKLVSLFEGDAWTAEARTKTEFDEALKQAEREQKSKLCYIEIFTDRMDIPSLTKKILKSIV